MRKSESVYDQNSYYANDGKGSRLSRVFNPLLQFLDNQKAAHARRKATVETRNVLDVGAGDGKFLAFFKKHRFNCYGTTASATSKNAAKSLFDLDLEFSKEIPDELQNKKFDLVTHWHVFEHLENPDHHAQAISNILADDGIWIVEVPNIESLGSKLCYRSWLGSDPVHHINHMTQLEFAELMNKYNLAIKGIDHFSLKFSFVYLWSALLGRLFGKAYDFDWIMKLLKNPISTTKSNPILALNAFAAIIYLAPFIFVLMIFQSIVRNGEIKRYYIRRLTS